MDSKLLQLDTPILLLIFNRLDTTKKIFEKIKKVQPKKLYISSDGARDNIKGEAAIVNSVRESVLNSIDWKCEVKTLFRDSNFGCKNAVSNAITWFFENEEMGIIIEDDCLPSDSFFGFCEKMLNLYKTESQVMMITGTNYLIDCSSSINSNHFFSRHFTIWGWATWKRAWEKYDVNINSWRRQIQPNDLKFISDQKYIQKHFEYTFDLIYNNKINTWDIQWVYACIFNNGVSVTPTINLIKNIGVDGTHTTGKVTDSHFLEIKEFNENCLFDKAKYIFPNEIYDRELHKQKSLSSYRHNLIRIYLRKIHVFNILKKIKDLLTR